MSNDAQVEVVEAEALRRRPRKLVGVDDALGEQHLLGSPAAVAGLARSRPRPRSRGAKPELDDVLGDEAPSRRGGSAASVRAAGVAASIGSGLAARASRLRRPGRLGSWRRRRAQSEHRRPDAGPAGTALGSFVSPSFAPLRIAPSGASRPVQRRKLAAPWWTRTSNPSTHRIAPLACCEHQAGCLLAVDEVHHDLPITPFIGGNGQRLEGAALLARN